jgi:ATP-dependent protease ClpP protease subunit
MKKLETLVMGLLVGAIIYSSSVVYKSMNLKSLAVATASLIEAKPTTALDQPAQVVSEESSAPEQKPDVIELTGSNTVVMDQVFTDQSVHQVMSELQKLSDSAPKSATLILFMNSPGGSVPAGLQLISFCKALPQKVITLTLFAASMGFQTVQQLDKRLILENGTLMSHQASFGVSGRTNEVKSRLKWILSMINKLDADAARRMQMSLADYQNMIRDEYWIYDQDAVKDHAADTKVLAKCGKGLEGTRSVKVATMFGEFTVEVAACPLIPGYISVKRPDSDDNVTNEYVKLMFTDRKDFTDKYIVNNKFEDFQK